MDENAELALLAAMTATLQLAAAWFPYRLHFRSELTQAGAVVIVAVIIMTIFGVWALVYRETRALVVLSVLTAAGGLSCGATRLLNWWGTRRMDAEYERRLSQIMERIDDQDDRST